MGWSTIAKVVQETCKEIWEELNVRYVKYPQTCEEWNEIFKGFEEQWQLPHCCGSIDGKYVQMECPANTGSLNFHYKGTFSKVLMAVVDSKYKSLVVDFGHYGGESDSGIFTRSAFGQYLLEKKVPLPKVAELPSSNKCFPYFLVDDEAFPL